MGLLKQHSIPEFCLELHRGFIPQGRMWSFPHVDFIQKMTDMDMGIMYLETQHGITYEEFRSMYRDSYLAWLEKNQ